MVTIIVIPDLYEIDRNSPFYVTNTALQSTVSRLNLFYVNHHLVRRAFFNNSLILPTNYCFLGFTDVQKATPHSEVRWQNNQRNLQQVNLIEDAIITAEVVREGAIATRGITAISDSFLNAMKHYDYSVKETVMPFCQLPARLINSSEAIKKHLNKFSQWLNGIVELFEQVTKLNFFIENITFDSFVYDEAGKLQYFIDYHKLKFASNRPKHVVEAYNIRQLAETLKTLRILSEVSEHLNNPDIFSKNDLFNRLATSEINYSNQLTTFEDFHRFINGTYEIQKDQRIGVFVDLAHLYRGLETYYVNFDVLLTSLLGEKKKWISSMHSVQFIPNYQDEAKNKRVEEWLAQFKKQLERYSFTVKKVGNDTQKAKRIIDGEEHDVDDQYLIQLMRQMRGQFTEIVVFTGDKHFLEELILQQNAGTKVHLVTSDELATSRLLKERFKENYHSIMEFVESIDIR